MKLAIREARDIIFKACDWSVVDYFCLSLVETEFMLIPVGGVWNDDVDIGQQF